MKRQYRLKRRAAFQYVYRKGVKSSVRDLVLLAAPSREGLKIGLSVSKKIGNAVVRNRTKRLLREALQPIFDGIDGDYMYVIVARSPAAEATYAEMCASVKSVFEKAGKLR